MADPTVIATWSFGRLAAETSLPELAKGTPALDSALAGAQAVEDDPDVHSVGFAGVANSIGTVSLDSCVMDGKTLSCGAVAGLENIRHAAAVAKKVMEKTPHVLLVGEGARLFAVQNGHELATLNTSKSVAEWEKRRPKPNRVDPDNHDTVTVLTLDKKGSLGGVCTTSGLAFKLPGRVGDSPLIGSGLYVDDEAGAAGATGVGEEIIRIGGSFLVVELMRSGKTPQQACEAAVARVNTSAIRRGKHPAQVAFLALNRKGQVGAACTKRTKFVYAVGTAGAVKMHDAPELEPRGK